MTSATARLETHPPLARDAAGNLLPLPAGTAAFCFSRETAGRPRKLCGPDKNPLRFPLHTTGEDLVELCGAGAYRVYALDQLGESLADDHVARWDLTAPSREHRNVVIDPMLALRADRTSNSSATTHTDLRFALETMAQMMRTNSDALRLVAESQVDLAKTIATVKGLPRNAVMSLPATALAVNDDSTDDDEDDGDDEEIQSAPTNPYDLLMPFSEAIAGKVADLIPGFLNTAPGTMTSHTAEATESGESKPFASKADDLASRGFEVRDLIDLDYAHRKGEAKREARKSSVAPATPLQARVMKDPDLLRLVIAIKKELPAEETAMLLSAAAKWPEAAQTKFIDTIKPLAVNEALVYCREIIATIREHERGSEGAA